MKTIISLITSLIILSITAVNSQSLSTSNTKVTVNYSSNDKGDKGYTTNISVSNTDEEYRLKADFPSEKTEEIRKFLNENLKVTMTNTYIYDTWRYTKKGKEGYVVKLKKGKISIVMDKELVSADFSENLVNTFDDLRSIIKE